MAAGLNIAVVGAGWAGLAAGIGATQAGHRVTVFEAASEVGGRARALSATLPDGTPVVLDNGQHILIGAYAETLRLMRLVGVSPKQALLDLPMTLQFPDGLGIRFAAWPTPLDALAGILGARGWSLADKWSLLRAASRWQRGGFQCSATSSVAQLCATLTPRINAELIDPLCVSALNTPSSQASAQVFLRVLRDALFGAPGGSHLLLPTTDLSTLFAQSAADWLTRHGAQVLRKARVQRLGFTGDRWRVTLAASAETLGLTFDAVAAPAAACELTFDAVVLATAASQAAQLLAASEAQASPVLAPALADWRATAQALRFEAIATVYAWAPTAALPLPMLALRNDAQHPAQFAFDRGALGGPRGLLAFVVSAAQGDRLQLQAQVLAQAKSQLGLDLQAVQTVVEKRATFACTPALKRPGAAIAPGLWACGDYVDGPYPATLEGAVRGGLEAAQALGAARV